MTFVVTQNCCNDATCVQVCPVDCIHPAPGEPGYATTEMLYIDPNTCIDCGACADVCPVEAISPDDSLSGLDLRYLDVNADFYTRDAGQSVILPTPVVPPKVTAAVDASVLRVAIIGSGPSACYAAEEVLSRRDIRTEVTMIERLPFAGGLVRYGVAPDHSKTKGVDKTFTRTIRRSGMSFYLNVEVGCHLSLDEVAAHHHAVIVATGATEDRRLGIEGESLPGVVSAREFVAWYNGHPDYADLEFDLSAERVVVVGNGNVALDVARVLVADIDYLRGTDIADHALDALARSAVREVVVLGRRGPEAAAGTVPELLGLAGLSGVDVLVDGDVAVDEDATYKQGLLAEYAAAQPTAGNRRIIFRFNSAPEEILGESQVSGIRLAGLDGPSDLACGLVLRSIGYRGAPFPGLPFDEARGTIANLEGRVVNTATGSPVAGRYVTGWIKRGPSGVIGTNRVCAQQTVEALIADFASGALSDPNSDAEVFDALVKDRRPTAMTAADWFTVDRHERSAGRKQRRPRVKLLDPRPALT
ncbi:FAD-dependent oxidoreductase [Gordonia sp. (in: high G+C Gram-positive bacteria)]|uniref:FAD-dependent oxidoreductase n=1 Tax=Gordonia sp. (in: high G+C Gram-positive bacteria) TaxID=84139 RepID=UPI003C790DCA